MKLKYRFFRWLAKWIPRDCVRHVIEQLHNCPQNYPVLTVEHKIEISKLELASPTFLLASRLFGCAKMVQINTRSLVKNRFQRTLERQAEDNTKELMEKFMKRYVLEVKDFNIRG